MYYVKDLVFKKNYDTSKEVGKAGACTGRKEMVHKNSLRCPDIRFTNKEFKSTFSNIFKDQKKYLYQ